MAQSDAFVDGICTCDDIRALCGGGGAGGEGCGDANTQWHKNGGSAVAVVAMGRVVHKVYGQADMYTRVTLCGCIYI